ncbi:MAG: hypothetical protein Q4Q07_09040 [Tissierellia bacterium]|nr:hypothetical protein [Tissierellia bacterium]
MAKILLTKSNVMKFVNQESMELILTPERILTPGAKDVCRNHKIKILYQDKIEDEKKVEGAESSSSPMEKNIDGELNLPKDIPLDHVIKQILRKQFKIVSEVEVWNITNKVLEEINKNNFL